MLAVSSARSFHRQRFKDEIKPMDKASEAILALKPVTFHYKHELDPDGIPQFGLVAEQVEKVNPDLVARDEQGKAYTVRYEAVNAMLLNEFLKAHRKVEEQDRKIAEQNNETQAQKSISTQLQSTVAKQEAAIVQERNEIEMLTSTLRKQGLQIQKISARLASRETSSRVAVNSQLKPK